MGRRRHNAFVRRSQDAAVAAANSRSIQFHDYNSNTIVLVTLGDSVEVTGDAESTMHGEPARSDTSHSSNSSSRSSSSSSASATGTGSGASSPAQSESEHAASSQEDEGSGGEVGLPVMVMGSEEASDAGDGSEDMRQSTVTDDDSKEDLEKRLAAGKFVLHVFSFFPTWRL